MFGEKASSRWCGLWPLGDCWKGIFPPRVRCKCDGKEPAAVSPFLPWPLVGFLGGGLGIVSITYLYAKRSCPCDPRHHQHLPCAAITRSRTCFCIAVKLSAPRTVLGMGSPGKGIQVMLRVKYHLNTFVSPIRCTSQETTMSHSCYGDIKEDDVQSPHKRIPVVTRSRCY